MEDLRTHRKAARLIARQYLGDEAWADRIIDAYLFGEDADSKTIYKKVGMVRFASRITEILDKYSNRNEYLESIHEGDGWRLYNDMRKVLKEAGQ